MANRNAPLFDKPSERGNGNDKLCKRTKKNTAPVMFYSFHRVILVHKLMGTIILNVFA